MAEYYPLLARAVSALSNADVESRTAVYDRARKALLAQLRAHDPPIEAEDIERESRALEEAISRLEAERSAGASRTPPSLTSRPSPSPKAAAQGAPAPAGATAHPTFPTGAQRPVLARRTAQRPAAPVFGASSDASGPAGAPPKAPELLPDAPLVGAPRRPTATERDPAPTQGARQAPMLAGAERLGPAPGDPSIPRSGIFRKFARPRSGVEDTGPLVVPQAEACEEIAAAQTQAEHAVYEPPAEIERQPEDISRPGRTRPVVPPPPVEGRRRSIVPWILAAIAAVVVLAVAALAISLRGNPQTLASRTQTTVTPAAKTKGKIVARVGAVTGAVTNTPSGGSPLPASGSTSSAPARPTPVAPAAQNQPASPPLPVAQRAALLIQAPTANDPQAIATYVGSVVWRLDTVNGGPNRPTALAVRAQINVPDAKFKGSMLFEKNTDPTLPASHTMEFRFTPGPGSPIGDVKQIDTPQMRKEDSPSGEPLAGIPAPITVNYFLVGLTSGDPVESHNLDLIRKRAWIDVPLLLTNGKVAKITFEKGVSGEKALNDALASWSK
ncbi:MAG TPA: hypothetical protein VND97_00235 [Beijerinckiaceae bacterium]|nr:hypothetical protein [Beijerinckiaceae bacterium]